VAGTDIAGITQQRSYRWTRRHVKPILRIEARLYEESLLQLSRARRIAVARALAAGGFSPPAGPWPSRGMPIADEEEARGEFTARMTATTTGTVAAPRVATA